ncbi:extracellular solute-binding protein [Paenibacillus koleovorans]|uniref:extracellular solute-binding protein n=1 Tax=Paenibacillus koleovorans TaxID=121608 RepID=UPI000FD75DF3|nr:extracellular solute-binding protein [Paenibacillus koleovorans]
MKWLKTLLIGSMAGTLALTGCSSGGSKDGAGASATPSSSSSSAPQGTAKQEKLKLSFFLYGANNAVLPSGQEDFVRAKIEEKFNVELVVENMTASTERKTKLTARIASGSDAPDLFLVSGTESGEFITQGVVADLSAYLKPDKMPNYFKWVTSEELGRFQIPKNFNRAPIPVAPNSYPSYWIRKDWLDKLNLKVPTSYEELTSVMQAFSKNDPDGNGKPDTYGYSQAGNGTNVLAYAPQFKKHGLIGGAFLDKDNNLHDVYSDPKMGAVLDDLRAWIKDGLVDPDWFLSNAAKVKEKFEQGRIGMVWLNDARIDGFESTPGNYATNLKKIVPTAQIIPIHPFPGTPNWVGNLPNTAFLVNKATADKEPAKVQRIMQILDWLASEEGYLLTHYGIQNKHYTKTGNKIVLNPDTFKAEIVNKGNFLSVWGFMTPEYPSKLNMEVEDPALTENDRQALKTIGSWPNAQGFGTSVVPPAGVNLADFRTPLYKAHATLLFDEKDASKWPSIREELLTKYKGREIFEAYVQQMRAVGIQVNDFK